MATKRLSLAEQLAELEEPTPVDFDPEGIHNVDSETDARPLNRDHYVDVGPSAKHQMLDISISDPKYTGIKVSRKELLDQRSDEVPDSGVEDSDRDSSGIPNGVHGGLPELSHDSGDEDDDREEEEELSDDSSEHHNNEYIPIEPSFTSVPQPTKRPQAKIPPLEGDLTHSLKQKREEDLRKGKSVVKQISIWNKIMESRIHIQKLNTDASRIPPPSILETLTTEESECQDSLKRLLDEMLSLSSELFDLRETLLPESIPTPPRKKRKLDPATDELSHYQQEVLHHTASHVALEQAYHPHLIQTLSKWSSKIQAVTPSALLPSNRNAFSSKPNTQQAVKPIVEQIDDTLASDYAKLLSRTRIRKGNKVIQRIGEPEKVDGEEEGSSALAGEDVEVFDDTDFYQQLLRDVIDSNGDEGDQSWKTLQKQRKAKKKVDTKASKGRKIRYEVHEKLQNFMVPIPARGGWHEEQIDELFASLLGKGVVDKHDGDVEMTAPTDSSGLNGLRLFG